MRLMKKYVFMIIISFFCLYLTACYVEYGCDISKKLEKTVTELNEKYVLDHFGFFIYGGEPNTDLFQKRGSNKFKTFYFSIHKHSLDSKPKSTAYSASRTASMTSCCSSAKP